MTHSFYLTSTSSLHPSEMRAPAERRRRRLGIAATALSLATVTAPTSAFTLPQTPLVARGLTQSQRRLPVALSVAAAGPNEAAGAAWTSVDAPKRPGVLRSFGGASRRWAKTLFDPATRKKEEGAKSAERVSSTR